MKRPKDFEKMNNSFRKYVVELEKERDELRMENMIHEHNREEGDRHWPDVKKQIEDKARKPLSQELQALKGLNDSWPLKDILKKLIESADILLDKKDYDGHGWEEISLARDKAKDKLKHIIK